VIAELPADLRVVRYDEPEILGLIDELAEEERQRYGDGDAYSHEPESYAAPHGCFLAAVRDGREVACAGYRAAGDGVVEVKRMYVQPTSRRRGLARRLLAALEDAAAARGARAVRLETGRRQPEAIALYETSGYTQIPNYGEFEDDPWSVCFEKRLAPASGSAGG